MSPVATPDLFRQGMRSLFSGVCLVATEAGGARSGLAASSVTSVSTDPPTVLVCVNRNASAHDALAARGAFAISVLAQNHADLAAAFSDGRRKAERFTVGAWGTGAVTGSPLLTDAPAAFDCRLKQTIDGGTHTIFIAEVVDIHLKPEPVPLLYGYGNFAAYVPRTVMPVLRRRITTRLAGAFDLVLYKNSIDRTEHFALIRGDVSGAAPVLAHLQAVNLLQDVLWDDYGGRGGRFQAALAAIAREGRGVAVLLYETSPYPSERLRYRSDAAEPRPLDLLEFGVCAQVLQDLGLGCIEILGERDSHAEDVLRGFGFDVSGWRDLGSAATPTGT